MPADDRRFSRAANHHPFGDRIRQHLSRKHGLSQSMLADAIIQDAAVITAMCQGRRLQGPSARERVVKIIKWFYEQGVLTTQTEADALLEAAGKSRLTSDSTDEAWLLQQLRPAPEARPTAPATPAVPEPRPTSSAAQALIFGSAPRLPSLVIGREDDVRNIKQQLNRHPLGTTPVQALTAVRGWPGVGKTTLAAVLAYDAEIMREFPDGVLWASLGQQPSIFAELGAWGRALRLPMSDLHSIEEASARLSAFLRDKRMLLIVDDVWEAKHVLPFQVGGSTCALLFTTRLPRVAQEVVPSHAIYILGVLTPEKALELLATLAPQVVAENPKASADLVSDLEGLPLAIHVAGHLLNVERSLGFGIVELLAEIREGARLIEAQAPADRAEVSSDTTPTVAALLKKSTDRLDAHTLDCFAYLGAFAPKPATFDAAAMKSVWQVADARPTIRTLVDRGLLEPSSDQRFWMHALLVAHARSLLSKDDSAQPDQGSIVAADQRSGVDADRSAARLQLDGDRLLAQLRQLGELGRDRDGGGRTRIVLTDEDKAGRDQLVAWMHELDLEVRVDRIGNIFGSLHAATDDGRQHPLMIGSHIDTVKHAGALDGCYGVLAGLAVVRAFRAAGTPPARSITIAAFTNEEGVRYQPDMMGSLVYAGGLSVEAALETIGADGSRLGDELARIGYAGEMAPGAIVPDEYLELHIEQGPILEAEHTVIGVVEHLQGISWQRITLEGAANHAGTTPMHLRHDAAWAAAAVITFLRELAVSSGTTLATVGSLHLEPDLINVIPRKAILTVDLRDPDELRLRTAEQQLVDYLGSIAVREGVAWSTERLVRFEPVTFDAELVRAIEASAARLGLSHRRMTSGAGHDAQMIARIAPTAMIFVPSRGGISHDPREHTDDEHLLCGAQVLLDVVQSRLGAS